MNVLLTFYPMFCQVRGRVRGYASHQRDGLSPLCWGEMIPREAGRKAQPDHVRHWALGREGLNSHLEKLCPGVDMFKAELGYKNICFKVMDNRALVGVAQRIERGL